MPNRRRRKLSTTMSAVAALAVASPCAYFLVYESTVGNKVSQHHEFKQAAQMTDMPGELMGALSQGLSQFGISLPPVPALNGASAGTSGLTSPGLTSPGLTSPGLTSPGLTDPGLTPATPGLTAPGALPTAPGGGSATAGTGLNPALSNPGLTNPAGGTSGLGTSSEVPITAPSASGPGADGTYPVLGDPSSFGPASPTGGGSGSGGLVNDAMQAANQLGAGQAIDLLKGVLTPVMQGAQQGGAGALPAMAPPV